MQLMEFLSYHMSESDCCTNLHSPHTKNVHSFFRTHRLDPADAGLLHTVPNATIRNTERLPCSPGCP